MTVLAIGGGASVGKTTLSLRISQLLDLDRVVHVDDWRESSFIDATPDVWSRPAAWLFDSLLAETEQLHDPIATEIDALIAARSTILIEGEGIEPRLCERWPLDVVRPVYVIEEDPERLRATFAGRSSGPRFLALSPVEQDAVVEMNRAYGSWLRTEADARQQPWVASQPWESLAQRVRSALRV